MKFLSGDLNDSKRILHEIARANFHRGGLKISRLFEVDRSFFSQLRDEVLRLVAANRPSDVQGVEHVTNWTKPFGTVFQFSLLNRSGILEDTSSDHDLSFEGKRFHLGAEYPAIGAFIAAFPQAINFRVNGLGPNSGLSPHEEHPLRYRSDRDCWLTARFHLPILTNSGAEALLDGDLFRMEIGSVFLFNNGCIHSARNSGSDTRYHLVWDMLLTSETYELMFTKERGLPSFLRRTTKDERIVPPHRRTYVREYQTYGPGPELHQKWKLDSFGIPVYRFQNWYTRWRYLRYLWRESVSFYRV